MLTRKEAVEMSINKWVAYSEERSPRNVVCGMCEWGKEQGEVATANEACEKWCFLYPDVCVANPTALDVSLYWQWKSEFITRKKKLALAAQILKEIRERGAKWILQEIRERGAKWITG